MNGVCGTADGTKVSTEPGGSALCMAGTATAVTETVPNGVTTWSWTCDGQFGGTNSKTCAATLEENGDVRIGERKNDDGGACGGIVRDGNGDFGERIGSLDMGVRRD